MSMNANECMKLRWVLLQQPESRQMQQQTDSHSMYLWSTLWNAASKPHWCLCWFFFGSGWWWGWCGDDSNFLWSLKPSLFVTPSSLSIFLVVPGTSGLISPCKISFSSPDVYLKNLFWPRQNSFSMSSLLCASCKVLQAFVIVAPLARMVWILFSKSVMLFVHLFLPCWSKKLILELVDLTL